MSDDPVAARDDVSSDFSPDCSSSPSSPSSTASPSSVSSSSSPIRYRSQNSGSRQSHSLKFGLVNNDPYIVRAEFAQESDINYLVAKYGAVPPAREPLVYGERPEATDLLEVYETLEAARDAWLGFSPEVRALWPEGWLEFVREYDESPREVDAKLGSLFPKDEEPTAGQDDRNQAGEEPAPSAQSST